MTQQFRENAAQFREKFAELDNLLKKQIHNPDENHIVEITKLKDELAIITAKVHSSYKKQQTPT